FAFLAARVQLKIDAEFPRFTSHLLEMVYPHYLAPTPSMAVVQMEPNHKQGVLTEGFRVAKGTALRSNLGKGDQTPCEYRTGQEVVVDRPVRASGFGDEQALLPFGARSFQGYRLLHEYFALPARYQFIELHGLGPGIRRAHASEIEILVLLDRHEPIVEGAVS